VTVLVTGATGFIGTALARRLVRDGREVALLVRPTSAVPDDLRSSCRLLSPEVGTPGFAEQLGELAPEVCFHLAGHVVTAHAPADVDPMVDANLRLGIHVADAVSGGPDVAFVNVGTIGQHHDSRPYGPVSLYAATKQAFADVLRYYAECTGVRAVTVEVPQVYGPDDHATRLVPSLARAHASGRPIGLSPGEQLVDLLHVDDVVAALLLAVPHAAADAPAFSLSGEPMTLRALVALLGDVLGGPVPVEWGARDYRPREMTQPWAGAPGLPGWAPQVELRAGLADALGATPLR
jgi:nucleoside-diphosphate-sugar epimerase